MNFVEDIANYITTLNVNELNMNLIRFTRFEADDGATVALKPHRNCSFRSQTHSNDLNWINELNSTKFNEMKAPYALKVHWNCTESALKVLWQLKTRPPPRWGRRGKKKRNEKMKKKKKSFIHSIFFLISFFTFFIFSISRRRRRRSEKKFQQLNKRIQSKELCSR